MIDRKADWQKGCSILITTSITEVNVFLNSQKQWYTNRTRGKEDASPLSGAGRYAHEK